MTKPSRKEKRRPKVRPQRHRFHPPRTLRPSFFPKLSKGTQRQSSQSCLPSVSENTIEFTATASLLLSKEAPSNLRKLMPLRMLMKQNIKATRKRQFDINNYYPKRSSSY